MQALTEDGQRIVAEVAGRHGFSTDAVYSLLMSLAAGGGRQAQFSHPEFGGMGQWSQGGMIMIGDMFNNGLKFRVDALCNDLAMALQNATPFATAPSSQSQSQSSGATGTSFFTQGSFANRWPAELGQAASMGSQNDLHYAVFPATRRLALDQAGHITVYDTGDHMITGFSQQQGGGQSITFTSQYGLVRLSDLPQVQSGAASPVQPSTPPVSVQASPTTPVPDAPVDAARVAAMAPPPPAFTAQPTPAPAATSADEIFSRLERLADLRNKDIITVAEFEAKKAELLARL